MRWHPICIRILVLTTLTGVLTCPARSQQLSSIDRDNAISMLDNISKEIQKHYYDAKFHGIDWAATARDARQKIKSSTSLNMALAHIAQAMVSLNDSHTFFLPPPRPYIHNYGYQTRMIGEQCFILRVRPGSDAESKGLKAGDELLALDGYTPHRDTIWKMEYRYNVLRPEPGQTLVLRDPQGQVRKIDIMAKIKTLARVEDFSHYGIGDYVRRDENEEHLLRARWAEVGDDVGILKIPVFMFDQAEVESMMSRAGKRPALILDLRGNPGGAVDTLKYLVGGLFEKDIKIADRVGRKESKPEVAKAWNHGVYTGKLVVLVDSRSASASELLARIVQLEKRGMVLGDRSSGSVMEARRYEYTLGQDSMTFYGASITESDLIMSDGNSLEHHGVTPDELVLPTAADLAAGRDPVLSRAVTLLGGKLSPEDAGKLFPYEWPKEQ